MHGEARPRYNLDPRSRRLGLEVQGHTQKKHVNMNTHRISPRALYYYKLWARIHARAQFSIQIQQYRMEIPY